MLDTILEYLGTPLFHTGLTPNHIVVAVVIVLVSQIAASILGRSLDRILVSRGLDRGLAFAINKISRYVVFTFGIFLALGALGLDTSAIWAGGAALLVGIGFGLQKLAENFISGLLVLIERPVRKGDFIDIAGVLGTVEDIGLRSTRVHTRDGLTVIVPNSNLMTSTVINHTTPTSERRVWIKVGVAYGTDLELATRVLLEVAAAEPRVIREPTPQVRHLGFRDSSVELALVCWIDDAKDDLVASSNLNFAIDKAFRERAIVMPFPQRDIHVHNVK